MANLPGRSSTFRAVMLSMIAGVLLAACSTPAERGTGLADETVPHDLSDTRQRVVGMAAGLLGTPYRYGGDSPAGFDCSGLVQYAHRKAGIQVPRTTGAQLAQARALTRQDLLPGDLVFFEINRQKRGHVGIYEGGGVFIHAPSSGKRVSRASLDNPYWRSRLIATRTFH